MASDYRSFYVEQTPLKTWSRNFSELVLIISGVAVLNLFSKMDIH